MQQPEAVRDYIEQFKDIQTTIAAIKKEDIDETPRKIKRHNPGNILASRSNNFAIKQTGNVLKFYADDEKCAVLRSPTSFFVFHYSREEIVKIIQTRLKGTVENMEKIFEEKGKLNDFKEGFITAERLQNGPNDYDHYYEIDIKIPGCFVLKEIDEKDENKKLHQLVCKSVRLAHSKTTKKWHAFYDKFVECKCMSYSPKEILSQTNLEVLKRKILIGSYECKCETRWKDEIGFE